MRAIHATEQCVGEEVFRNRFVAKKPQTFATLGGDSFKITSRILCTKTGLYSSKINADTGHSCRQCRRAGHVSQPMGRTRSHALRIGRLSVNERSSLQAS